MSKDKSSVNKAQDGFKNYCKQNGMNCKRDTIFNDSHATGKGDVPRNVGQKFKENFDSIFPNSFKPSWMKNQKNNK